MKFLNRRFFAYPWQYEGQIYYISDDFYAGTNYFNLEGRPAFAILQEKGNGYFKLLDDNKLEKILLDEILHSLRKE